MSPACRFCYAEAFAKRVGQDVWGATVGRRFFGDEHWAKPLKWDRAAQREGRPKLVFCASMADVFEDRDDLITARGRLFDLIGATPHLQWQLLTKRPEHVRAMLDDLGISWPGNAWVGATVEDQERAEERIGHLVSIDAPVRFLSYEPALGALNLTRWLYLNRSDARHGCDELLSERGERGCGLTETPGVGRGRGRGGKAREIHWVICGGESGARHRPLDLAHARDVRDQCAAADVPFFFKQVGGRTPTAGGDELDGRRHKAFPPQAQRPAA